MTFQENKILYKAEGYYLLVHDAVQSGRKFCLLIDFLDYCSTLKIESVCSPEEALCLPTTFHAGFLLDLLFDPEHADDVFLRNAD
jgi:hypothetical protein